MNSRERVARVLRGAQQSNTLVVISRRSKFSGRSCGFVVGVGSKWLLLQLVDEAGAFDGHIAVRIDDVAKIKGDKSFAARAAVELPHWPPMPPGPDFDLDSTRGLLQSFADASESGLIGIEKERERNAQWIGVFDEIIGKFVYLHEVRPSGKWYKRSLGYKIGAITSIGMGGLYRTALARHVDWSARPVPPA